MTKDVVSPPEIWALQFSLDNKYIVAAGGNGHIDVIDFAFFMELRGSHEIILGMGSWSKTIMCQL